jgi:hypothetical protein
MAYDTFTWNLNATGVPTSRIRESEYPTSTWAPRSIALCALLYSSQFAPLLTLNEHKWGCAIIFPSPNRCGVGRRLRLSPVKPFTDMQVCTRCPRTGIPTSIRIYRCGLKQRLCYSVGCGMWHWSGYHPGQSRGSRSARLSVECVQPCG